MLNKFTFLLLIILSFTISSCIRSYLKEGITIEAPITIAEGATNYQWVYIIVSGVDVTKEIKSSLEGKAQLMPIP